MTLLFFIIRKIGRYFISRGFSHYSKKGKDKDNNSQKRIDTLNSLSLNAFQYVLAFLWIYSMLSIIGIPVGTLVASAGIFSLAIGLGAQGFVSDIVSGFFILFEKQVDVGEYVLINGIEGTISSIGLRTTQITTPGGTVNFIQNRNITSIANLSRNNMAADIQIKIDPNTPIEKAIDIIKQVNEKYVPETPAIIEEPNIRGTVPLENGEIALQIILITKNGEQFKVKWDFLAYYLEAFHKNGIKLPSNQIIMKSK